MTPVTVLPVKFIRGWPEHEIGGAVEVVDLLDALETDYPGDAHFAGYATPNGRRLTKRAIDHGVFPTLTVVVFDVDCTAVHGTPTPAPESWRQDVRARVVKLSEDHPDPYYYETRGGARVVYTQAEPTVLRTREDAKRWRQDYLIACAYLRRRYGLEADAGCSDWQRLYRLPCATRDVGKGPENWPTWSGPTIGSLFMHWTPEDVREQPGRRADRWGAHWRDASGLRRPTTARAGEHDRAPARVVLHRGLPHDGNRGRGRRLDGTHVLGCVKAHVGKGC